MAKPATKPTRPEKTKNRDHSRRRKKLSRSKVEETAQRLTAQLSKLPPAAVAAALERRPSDRSYLFTLVAAALTEAHTYTPEHYSPIVEVTVTGSRLSQREKVCNEQEIKGKKDEVDAQGYSVSKVTHNVMYPSEGMRESETDFLRKPPQKVKRIYRRASELPDPTQGHRAPINRTKKQIAVRLNPEMIEFLDGAASAAGVTRNELIENALESLIPKP